jgi:hypothetical protein
MNKSLHPGTEQWRQIIDGQRPSGLTIAAYCRDTGITEGSFYLWKKRLSGAVPSRPKHLPASAFVEVNPLNPAKANAIEIVLHNKRRLLVCAGFDRKLLLDLIRTLEGMPSRLEATPSNMEATPSNMEGVA